MSATFSTDDDANAAVVPPAASLKFKLPHFPPGREELEVKQWFKDAIAAINKHRFAHVLRLVAKDQKDMTDKEYSDNAMLTQAVYDCLSSEGERRRLRSELGSDAEHSVAAISALAQAGVKDSDLSEALHREELRKAMKESRDSARPCRLSQGGCVGQHRGTAHT